MRKLLSGFMGGLIGFLVGVFGGGYLGLIIGGTFLGSLDIHKNFGIEGYELAAYIGAIVGGIILAAVGVKIALRIAENNGSENEG